MTASATVALPPAAGTTGERRRDAVPALDGLRAVAVLMVVAYHLCEDRTGWFRGGWAGVDVFFVLSGYLVTGSLIGEHSGSPDIVGFLQRRVARLVPALVPLAAAGLACTLLAPALLGRTVSDSLPGSVSLRQYGATWMTAVTGSENVWAAHGGSPVPGLSHLWSLCVEWQFYLCWPFLVVALPRRALLWVAAVIGTLSALSPLFSYGGAHDRPAIYFGTTTHLVAISAGALVAQVPRNGRWTSGPLRVVGWPALVAIGLLLGESHLKYQLGALVTAAAAAGLVHAYTREGVRGRVLSRRPLRWIGHRSYGIYLWHFPVLCALAPFGTTVRLAGVGMAVALAAVSYRWVELPVRRRLRGYQSRRALAAADHETKQPPVSARRPITRRREGSPRAS